MAGKLTATTVTVTILFFFLASAFARAPLDRKDDAASIILPSERPEAEEETKYATSEPEIHVTVEPESETKVPGDEIETEPKLAAEMEIEAEDKTEADAKTHTVPLTVISFRPINRHFPRRPFQLRGHKCRHQFRRGPVMKPWLVPLFAGRQLPYGRDMVFGADDNGAGPGFDLSQTRGGEMRMVPSRWPLRPRGPRFPYEQDLEEKVERKPFRKHRHEEEDEEEEEGHGRYRHYRHHEHDHDQHNRHRVEGGEFEKEEEHKHKGGFVRKIRKFLHGF